MVTKDTPVISRTLARRLAVAAQFLDGPRRNADAAGIMDVIGHLGCLQIDPINIVARSHLLVLWSRLGAYDPKLLDSLLWQERRLFEYWAHAASIVLTQDYPLHQLMMRQYGKGTEPWSQKVGTWMQQNETLRTSMLTALAQCGPLRSRDFEDTALVAWQSTGWTGGRNVGRMLDFLWAQGQIMVAKRVGSEKWWDLAEHCLPAEAAKEPLSEHEVVRCATQKSLLALGVATEREIAQHFICGRCSGVSAALTELEATGSVVRVRICEPDRELVGPWFIHTESLPVLERLERNDWEPRTTLLSPFDNLIRDRQRTARLFDFTYQSEIYTPKDKRRFGYYVMPILAGEQLIGRIDPVLDRKNKRLVVNAVHVEPAIQITQESVQAVTVAIEDLARFLGAATISYGHAVPEGWQHTLS